MLIQGIDPGEDTSKEDARAKISKLSNFIRAGWHILEPTTSLQWGWALAAVCDHLEAVSNNEIKRLIINIAPRAGKSLITSVHWPAWSWLKYPSINFLFASYSMQLAIKLSLDCRRLVESKWYQQECLPDFKLTSDQNVKGHFENDRRGMRFATAMTAVAGGFGAEILVVDDPHNRDDANSQAAIKASIDGWKFNLYNCLNDKINGRIVVVGQRVCVGDLTDELLAQGGWEHLNLPMEYDGAKRATSLGAYDKRTTENELLLPDRFHSGAVIETKKLLGNHGYSAQYQQQPSLSGGSLFDIDKFNQINPATIPWHNLRLHRHWDLAATAEAPGKDPDYTASAKFGVDDSDNKIYILDVVKFRDNPAGVETRIKQTAINDGQQCSITIEEEKASAGKHTASFYARHVLAGFIFRGQPIHGDKVARARAFAAQVEAGNVYVPENAPWLFDYFAEMKDWPNSKHKDQGDASSGAFNELMFPVNSILGAGITKIETKVLAYSRPTF